MLALKPIPVPRSRPGRPSKANSALIDARILEAAWQLFTEQGYGGTSMEAIAERAGVTRATLYQRHEDKISLFRASLTNRGEAWSQVATGMEWLNGDTLEDRLYDYARQMLTFSQKSEISASRHLAETMQGEAKPIAYELVRSFRRRTAQLLADDIATYAERDGIAVRDPNMIATLVTGLLEAIIGEAQREGHDLEWMTSKGVRSMEILLAGREVW
jgi:TetR/AcrR family transcriptional regulator, mexJK operon transcriptional repressor